MAKVKVTQIKSKNGATVRQIATLQSLGIRRLHQSVELELNEINKGMISKVMHLVKVEELS